MPQQVVPRATRRAALGAMAGGVLVGGVLAACDAGSPPSTGSSSGATTSPSATLSTSPTPSADLLLAEQALAATETMLAQLVEEQTRVPGLAVVLGPLVGMHQAHRTALLQTGASPPTPTTPPVLPGPGIRTLRIIRTQERDLQRTLVGCALAAQDGALARLCAVMSAGIAGHLAGLEPGAAT